MWRLLATTRYSGKDRTGLYAKGWGRPSAEGSGRILGWEIEEEFVTDRICVHPEALVDAKRHGYLKGYLLAGGSRGGGGEGGEGSGRVVPMRKHHQGQGSDDAFRSASHAHGSTRGCKRSRSAATAGARPTA